MRTSFWQFCFTFMLMIGFVIALVPMQTALASDSELHGPRYDGYDLKSLLGDAKPDEVFATQVLDSTGLVPGNHYGHSAHQNLADIYVYGPDGPIEFEIEITRYFGPVDDNGKLLHPSNIENGTVQLSLRAFDVDADYDDYVQYANGHVVQEEIDEVYINDQEFPIGKLSGYNNQWSLTTFDIPVEDLIFPDLDDDGYVIPAKNKIKIEVDVGNEDYKIWATTVEWGWFTIKGVRPVVLVHGFLSSEDTWVEWTKPGGYVEEHGIPMHTFSFPHNHQDWKINAYFLGDQLAIAKDRFGVSKLNVIGHSKGGLDTRGYLHLFKQFDTHVENLFMLGTPNGGSPLASLGTTLAMVSPGLDYVASSIAEPALTQLTLGYMTNTFNQIVQENPQVDYHVIPGFCCTSIFMGQSDKIVPVYSVLKLPYAENIGLTEDDHFTLTKNREVFDIVIDKLGIRSHSRGLRTFGTNAISEEVFFQMGDGGVAEVSVGETKEHSFRLQADSAPQLVIMTETPVAVTVLNPSKQEVVITTESFFDTEEYEELFPRMEVTITGPIDAGTWTLNVSHLSETDEPTKYGWMVADVGGPTLHVGTTPIISATGETTVITATVEGLDEAEELIVQAVIRLPNGAMAAEPVELTHRGNGKYEGEFIPDHNQPGTYMVLVTAENDDLMRRQLSSFSRLSSSESLPESYTANGVDTDNDGLFDWLEVEVPLQINNAGTYLVNADLYDGAELDNWIAATTVEAELEAGATSLSLRFSGETLAASRFSTDLTLANVQLYAMSDGSVGGLDEPGLRDWQAGAIASFSTFTWEEFQRPAISVLAGIEDNGTSVDDEGKFRQLTVTVPIHVLRAGNYNYNARLVAADGTELGLVGDSTNLTTFLEAGDHELILRFSGIMINLRGLDGPYMVKDFTFWDGYYMNYYGGESIVMANLHETKSYKASDFINLQPYGITLDDAYPTGAGEFSVLRGKVVDNYGEGVPGVTVEFSFGEDPSLTQAITSSKQGLRGIGSYSGSIQLPEKVGPVTLKATAQGTNISVTREIVVTPGNISKLSFVDQPKDTVAGEIMEPVTVHLLDEFDNLVTDYLYDITVSISGDSTGELLKGTTTVYPPQTGVVTFDDLSMDTVGTYTLKVETSYWGLNSSFESEPFTITSGDIPPSIHELTLNVNSNEVIAGQTVTISGQVLDGENNGLSGVIVGFSVEGEAPALTQVVTDEDGTYTTSFLPTIAGNVQLTANVQETDISKFVSIEVIPAPASKLIFNTQPLDTTAGETLSVVQVHLFDPYDNLSTDALDVTLSLTDGNSGVLYGMTTVTAVEGVATFDDLRIDTAGTYTLTAAASGLTGVQSEEFTVEAKPSDGEPGEGSSFADQLTITQPTESILYSSYFPIAGKVAADSTVTASVYSDQNMIVLPAFAVDVTPLDGEIFAWTSTINEPLAPGAYQLRITAERSVEGVTESTTKVHDFIIPSFALTGVTVHEHVPDQAVFTFNQNVDASLHADHFAGLKLDSRQVVTVESIQGANVTVRLDDKVGASDLLVVTYVAGTTNVYALGNPLNPLPSITEQDQTGIAKDNGIIPFTLVSVYTEDGQLNLVFNKPVHDAATLHGFTFGGQPLQGAHSISGNTMTATLPAEPASDVLSYDPAQGNITEMGNVNNPLSGLLPGIDLGENRSYISDSGQLLDNGIRLNNGNVQLSPAFDPNHAGVYEVAVPNQVQHVSLDPEPIGHAGTFVKVSINGVEHAPDTWDHLPLQVGLNTIMIEVVDQSNPHVVHGQYKVTLMRESSGSQETPTPSPPVMPVLPVPSGTEIIEIEVMTGGIEPVDIATLVIERTTHPDGTLTDQVTFDEEDAETVVSKARETGETIIRTAIPDAEDEVSEVKVDISAVAAQMLAENGIELEIYTDNAIIRLSSSSLTGIDDDVYFRLVPVKDSLEHAEIEDRANIESIVRDIAGDEHIEVVARPMMIETNLPPNRQVTLVLPLSDVELPEEPTERAAFLAQLGVFIEHSDGDKEVVSGTVVPYDDELLGLEFTVSKFSTFTILRFGDPELGTHSAYITGFPDGEFKPNESLTRGQMAIMIAKNLGFDVSMTVDGSAFSDVSSGHYAASAIAFVHAQGIVNGYPDGHFRAEQAITRAEMATIVAHYLNLTTTEGKQSNFHDTAGHWAHAAIEANFAAGIVVGYADGSFRPHQHVTRAEAVVIVNRMFNRGSLQGVHVPIFPDVAETHWAYQHIQEAAIDHDYVIDMLRQEQWISE